MSLSLMDHRQEILNEVIGRAECRAGLAEGGQILLLQLIQALGITRQEPSGSVGSIFLDPLRVGFCLDLSLFERLQIAVDGSR